MKYLSDYMEAGQTKIFKKYGVFFAFDADQFNVGIKKIKNSGTWSDGENISNMGSGMYCPSKNARIVHNELSAVYTSSIEQDIKENGISNIIQRELDNHEYVITCDIEDTVECLRDYAGIDEDRIISELSAWRAMRRALNLD